MTDAASDALAKILAFLMYDAEDLHRPKDLHASYWEKPARVRAQSPSTFAHRMATPTLVIHGNNDYRVPDANGLAYCAGNGNGDGHTHGYSDSVA